MEQRFISLITKLSKCEYNNELGCIQNLKVFRTVSTTLDFSEDMIISLPLEMILTEVKIFLLWQKKTENVRWRLTRSNKI